MFRVVKEGLASGLAEVENEWSFYDIFKANEYLDELARVAKEEHEKARHR